MKAIPDRAARCIDIPPCSTPRILEGQDAGIREHALARIDQLYRYDIVLSRQPAEGSVVGFRHKIGDHEEDGAALEDELELLECTLEIGSGTYRLERENLTKNAKYVAAALAGRYDALDRVGEKQRPHPIIVTRCS